MRLLIILAFFLLLPVTALAAGFQLTAIGAMDVTGATSTKWWYSTDNPALAGTATANSTVTITIDSVASTTTADASGVWSYTPTALTAGDHSVELSADAGSQSFTLTIGDIPANVSAPTTSDLPVAGVFDQALWLWLIGGAISILGVAFLPIKSKA